MPAFDPDNPIGPAGSALYKTAELISGLANFQLLSATGSAAEALQLIEIGVAKEPQDRGEFTVAELQREFVANIYPTTPSQGAIVSNPASPTPLVSGSFDVLLRRPLTDGEAQDRAGRNSLYLWFFDIVTGIQRDIQAAADSLYCPRLRGIVPVVDAAFCELEEISAQGEYLYSQFQILWGDEVGE